MICPNCKTEVEATYPDEPLRNCLTEDDKNFLWSLMPQWVKEQPKELDPTFYGTLSREGDIAIKEKLIRLLRTDYKEDRI